MDTLKVLQWNIRSLIKNLPELQKTIDEQKPHILCLSETLLKPHFQNIRFKNYDILRKDRQTGNGGGIAILVRKELNYKKIPLTNYRNGNMECLAITVNLKNIPIDILACYSPPGQLNEIELEHYCNNLQNKTIICGDLNARHSEWDTKGSNTAGNTLHNFLTNSEQLSVLTPKDLPTRYDVYRNTDSTIDLFIGHSSLTPYAKIINKPLTGSSDHYPTQLTIDMDPIWDQIKFRGKWKINNDLWPKWCLLLKTLSITLTDSVENSINQFTEKLTETAKGIFKKSSGVCSTKYSAPWWNEECALVRAHKRRAKGILKRQYSINNLINYKKAAAICKRTIRKTKKQYWKDYCSQLTATTPLTKVWRIFNSIKRKQAPDTFPLNTNNLLSPKEKANIMADFYEEQFNVIPVLTNEAQIKNEIIEAKQYQHHAYNIIFKKSELEMVIKTLPKNKASGIDEIPYEFLCHLNENFSNYLLKIINSCWTSEKFPTNWKHAIILPFIKPNKDPAQPASYRPLSLLSNIGKIFEKLILNRMYWYLENNTLLPEYQTGFRKERSTEDQLARLEHSINKSLKEKKVVITVYFDISKAFDKVPHLAVLAKLARTGIKGRMLANIESFLTNRTFQVSLLGEISEQKEIKCGVPQGSILSPLLFIIFIMDLPEMPNTKVSAFADDICFFTVAKTYNQAINQMQNALNMFKEWCDKWSIKINVEKTHSQYFTRKRNVGPPRLTYGTTQIEYKRVCKFLGLHFDSPRLTWNDHIKYLIENCNKRINLLKAVSSTKWGADRKTLLRFYKAYILSKITYGSSAFGSACKTTIEKLEVLQNTALRIITGALKSTPIDALRCEINISSVNILIEKLSLKYFTRANYFTKNHPVKKEIIEDEEKIVNLPWGNQTYKLPGIMRTVQSSTKWNIPHLNNMPNVSLTPIPPWTELKIIINLELIINLTKNTANNILKTVSEMTININYKNHLKIYTDGSRAFINNEWRSASALYIPERNEEHSYRLNGINSILTAELFAILKALKWTINQTLQKSIVILVDSKAALQSITSSNPKSKGKYLVYECLKVLKTLQEKHINVILQWIPSHIGVPGNEKVDNIAKSALHKNTIEDLKVSLPDVLKPQRKTIIIKETWTE